VLLIARHLGQEVQTNRTREVARDLNSLVGNAAASEMAAHSLGSASAQVARQISAIERSIRVFLIAARQQADSSPADHATPSTGADRAAA